MEERDDTLWVGYVAGGMLALVLGSLCWLVFGQSRGAAPQTAIAPGGPAVTGKPEAGKAADSSDPTGQFAEFLKTHQPKVSQLKMPDPADGQPMQLPSADFHNQVGGAASDLMWLALDVDPKNPRRPVAGKQEWQVKLGTSPSSKATYMEVDLMNARGGRAKDHGAGIKQWDLAKLCPPLAALPPEQWTDDERNYVHYWTMRQMGFDDTEQGFAALTAAYASNFALWHGDERTVPAAAYYALAAAHFERSMAAQQTPDPRSTGAVWMICGEMHRLLGQLADAQRCFEAADKLRGAMQPEEQQTLDFYRGLVAKSETSLQRLPHTGVPEPPIGWYIDNLLPAIDADLDVERAQWAALKDVDAITAAINARIAEKRGKG
jgi:hypothetical protein